MGSQIRHFQEQNTWFGYKIHLAVDSASELPLALEVTPAHVNDGDMGPALMEQVAVQQLSTKLDFVMMDAG